jgi:hypothetical protein
MAHRTSNVNAGGYRRILVPGHPMAVDRGWALEHRVIAWDHFGPFDPSCVVHHKNHDRLDNRPENLEVLTVEEHKRRHAVEDRRYDRTTAANLYRSGLTINEVAARMGADSGHCYRMLLAEGVEFRRDRWADRREWWSDVKPQVQEALRAGDSVAAVSRRFSIDRKRVSVWRDEAGIPAIPAGTKAHR